MWSKCTFLEWHAGHAIKDIQEEAQKQLLHASARWPVDIHLAPWPYAGRYTVFTHNAAPTKDDGHSRLELIAGIWCETKMKENHTFGCTKFTPQKDLQ